MPIFWFGLINIELNEDNWLYAFLVFIILHLFTYPASNGYNSYCDKDEGSIGGIEKPPIVNEYLIYLVILFDVLAVALSLFLNIHFAIGILIYLLVSKAYSWPQIRIKKYPILSTVIVTLFQGAFTYLLVFQGIEGKVVFNSQVIIPAVTGTLFLAGSYPITQIYQHEEDAGRGDKTLSLLLGIKGTFIFAGLMFIIASALMCVWLNDWGSIAIYFAGTGGIGMFFTKWALSSLKNPEAANFKNTMRMNKISSLSLSATFILIKVYTYIFL